MVKTPNSARVATPRSPDAAEDFERACMREMRNAKAFTVADYRAESGYQLICDRLTKHGDGIAFAPKGVGADVLREEVEEIRQSAKKEAEAVVMDRLRVWGESRGFQALTSVTTADWIPPQVDGDWWTLDDPSDFLFCLEESLKRAPWLSAQDTERGLEDAEALDTAAEAFIEYVVRRRVAAWAVARGLTW